MAMEGQLRTQLAEKLGSGEDVQFLAQVQLAALARSTPGRGVAGAAGAMIGDTLVRGKRRREDNVPPGSVAASFPSVSGVVQLAVTDRRALVLEPPLGLGDAILWEVPRARLAGVEAKRRTQALARFVLRFDDQSSLGFMTPRRRTIEGLKAVLGG